MVTNSNQRALLEQARQRLDEWRYVARDRAYSEMFERPGAVLSDAELRQLDRIDSRLAREIDEGLWGADEYGIIQNGAAGNDPGFRVVCTSHPGIPYEGYRGLQSLDEATREQFNDVLWDYCRQVAEYIQDQLDEFVRESAESTTP
jgi:hypothetical protein